VAPIGVSVTLAAGSARAALSSSPRPTWVTNGHVFAITPGRGGVVCAYAPSVGLELGYGDTTRHTGHADRERATEPHRGQRHERAVREPRPQWPAVQLIERVGADTHREEERPSG
jgi:hypothetical protein